MSDDEGVGTPPGVGGENGQTVIATLAGAWDGRSRPETAQGS